jgi:hypothetical protein
MTTRQTGLASGIPNIHRRNANITVEIFRQQADNVTPCKRLHAISGISALSPDNDWSALHSTARVCVYNPPQRRGLG